jgi:hypothetical protein
MRFKYSGVGWKQPAFFITDLELPENTVALIADLIGANVLISACQQQFGIQPTEISPHFPR